MDLYTSNVIKKVRFNISILEWVPSKIQYQKYIYSEMIHDRYNDQFHGTIYWMLGSIAQTDKGKTECGICYSDPIRTLYLREILYFSLSQYACVNL